MTLWLLACVAATDELCAPGTIKLGSSGESFQRLESALDAAEYTDGICLGEGTWEIDEPLQLEGDEDEEGRWIDIFGAGSDQTVLRAPILDRFELRFDTGTGSTHAGLRGLTLENLGTLLVAGDVVLEDVVSRSDRQDVGLVVQGFDVVATNVEVTGHRWMHQDGLGLRARDTLVVEELVVADNEHGANFSVVLNGHGGVTWKGGAVVGNTGIAGTPQDRFLTVGGGAEITSVDVDDNLVSGSLFAVDDDASFLDVNLRNNVGAGEFLMWGPGTSWMMSGGRVRNNSFQVATLGVYGEGLLTLDQVDLKNPETPCEVAGSVDCLGVEAGPAVSVVCSTSACTGQE